MAPAPEKLGGARTLFHAIVTPQERWTAGNRIVIADAEAGAFAGLAICGGQAGYFRRSGRRSRCGMTAGVADAPPPPTGTPSLLHLPPLTCAVMPHESADL